MTESASRHRVMDWRASGRTFWLALIGSIGLHGLLLSGGGFSISAPQPQVVIEARLEINQPTPPPPPQPAAAKAVPPRPREATPWPPAPVPETTQGSPGPVEDALATAEVVEPSESPAEATSPPAGLPPSRAAAALPEAGPHAALTMDADNAQDWPSPIEIVYELKGLISGRQVHRWVREDHRYTLETRSQATGLAGVFLSGEMTQHSAGRIGDLGLMPERYEMIRLSGKKEVLVFNYDAQSVDVTRIDPKKGVRTSELPLLSGTQDPLSSIYQLALVARSNPAGAIVAASAKRVKGYPYRVVGSEILDTPLGTLGTVHVTRNDDSQTGSVHLWLSPDRHFLPVRISYTDDDGREWILQATRITLK